MNKRNNNVFKNIFPYLILCCVITAVLMFLNYGGNITHELSTGELMNYINKEKVTELVITPKSSESIYYITGKLKDYKDNESFEAKVIEQEISEITDYATTHKLKTYKNESDPGSSKILYIIVNVLPLAILVILSYVLFNKMASGNKNSMDFGRSRAKLSEDGGNVKFDSVAGLDEEKQEVAELIDFLKNPKKFQKLGARIPKGVLLVGPPGTGKTLTIIYNILLEPGSLSFL